MDCEFCNGVITEYEKSNHNGGVVTHRFVCLSCLGVCVQIVDPNREKPINNWIEYKGHLPLPSDAYKTLWEHKLKEEQLQPVKDLDWVIEQVEEHGRTRGSHIATMNVVKLIKMSKEFKESQEEKKGEESS